MSARPRTVSLFLTLALSVAPICAVPVASGPMSVGSHPSLLVLQPRVELRTQPLPLGLVTDISAALRFVSYAGGAVPEPQVDLGSLIIGLSNVDILPFRLPSSPTALTLEISADTVTLTSSGGDVDPLALLQHVSESPTRAALDRAEFSPVWSATLGGLRIDLGSSIGAVPFDAVGDTSLITLLGGAPVRPLTRYGIDLRSVADVSLATRVSWGWRLPVERGVIVPAVSVLVPLSIAHAESLVGAWIDTGAARTPTAAGTSWQVVYWFPGSGVGVGARLSGGIAWQTARHAVGVSVFSLFSGWRATGTAVASGEETGIVHISDLEIRPSPVLFYVWNPDPDAGASVALQAGYRDGPVASVVAVKARGAVSVVAGVGFERGVRAGAGVGFRTGRLYLEPVLEIRHHRPTGTTIGGVVVSIARVGARGQGRIR